MRQRFCIARDGEDYVSAASPVTAVGAAAGNIFFTTKGDRAASAVAGTDLYLRLVGKQGGTP